MNSVTELRDEAKVLKASPTGRRFRVLTATEVLNRPPLHWLVRGAIPGQGVACIYGPSLCAKSFLALDLCAAVVEGREWFGCRVSAAPVVYVVLEGEAGFRQRIKAWQTHHGREIPSGLRFIMQPLCLRDAQDVAALAAAVSASGAAGGLLVIDTLNRASGNADENSARDMGEIIDAAKALQAKLGGTVLLIHHTGKDQTRGLRGHSSLLAALDSALEVRRDGEQREWSVAKSKDEADGGTFAFQLKVVEVGFDEMGDPITSCVVLPEARSAQVRRALPPTAGNQRVAWNALIEMLRRPGVARPKSAPARLPAGRSALSLESAIDAIRERLVCDPKRKTERARQALTGLQAKGLVVIESDFVWLA